MSARRWSLRAAAAALLIAGLVPVAWPQSRQPAPRPEPQTPLGTAWTRPLPNLVALTLSPEGERVVAADAGGGVYCFDRRGTVLWRKQLPGVDSLAVSAQGTLTLAYAARRPLARQVHFINERGHHFRTLELSAPVRSAIVSRDGRYAAIGAGKSFVFCSRRGEEIRRRVVPVPGEVRQLQFGPGDSVYVTCDTPSCVALVKSSGKVLWKRQGRGVRRYTLSASGDGRLAAIGTEREPDTVEVSLVSAENKEIWLADPVRQARGAGGRALRVRLSAGGTAVVLAYELKLTHQQWSRFERRLNFLDREGRPAWPWPKGGAYSTPLYVSVDRDGEWVVGLDTLQDAGIPRFRLFGRNGERRWSHTCPAHVLLAVASAEGRQIAVYRADRRIELIEVASR